MWCNILSHIKEEPEITTAIYGCKCIHYKIMNTLITVIIADGSWLVQIWTIKPHDEVGGGVQSQDVRGRCLIGPSGAAWPPHGRSLVHLSLHEEAECVWARLIIVR